MSIIDFHNKSRSLADFDSLTNLLLFIKAGKPLDLITSLNSAVSNQDFPVDKLFQLLDSIEKSILIPAGSFQMGSETEQWNPVRSVKVSGFWIHNTPFTNREWHTVSAWANGAGYGLEDNMVAKSYDDFPVTELSWHEAVKFCNAKSEMMELTRCSSVNGLVYREDTDGNVVCDWTADGYRLPTGAEWEKAARGGLTGKMYPNGDSLSERDANFNENKGGTTQVKDYPPNGYDLYDMTGNVCEWCWDWHGPLSFESNDPKGPDYGEERMLRGGGWDSAVEDCRVSTPFFFGPHDADESSGFRLVRSFGKRLPSG